MQTALPQPQPAEHTGSQQVAFRAMVMQHKSQRPVQFEITPAKRDAVQKWIKLAALKSDDFVFPYRIYGTSTLTTEHPREAPGIGFSNALFT